MKREIIFRGKRIDNGEWVYGYFWHIKEHYNPKLSNRHCIKSIKNGLDYEVIPETIGQLTGLNDKYGVKIFEGDILLSESWGSNARSKRKTHIVEWGREKWLAAGYNGEMKVKPSLDTKSDWQVIGNIHDNKELIKE